MLKLFVVNKVSKFKSYIMATIECKSDHVFNTHFIIVTFTRSIVKNVLGKFNNDSYF